MGDKQKLFAVRSNMMRRCYTPGSDSYAYYGALGVTVCEEWRGSSAAFYGWCIENGWRPGLYIDRIKNELGYSPSNCRFVTPAESARNRRNNVLITAWGETKLQIDWLSDPRRIVSCPSILKRCLDLGMSGEDALTYRGKEGKPTAPITAWGETKYLCDWLNDARCRADRFQIRKRIAQGVRPEEALSKGAGWRITREGYQGIVLQRTPGR